MHSPQTDFDINYQAANALVLLARARALHGGSALDTLDCVIEMLIGVRQLAGGGDPLALLDRVAWMLDDSECSAALRILWGEKPVTERLH